MPGPAGSDVALTLPRAAGRRSRGPMAWWAKAWARAVEEAAYGERELRGARSLARAGLVGRITLGRGSFVAAVQASERDPDELCTVAGAVPVFDAAEVSALVETVAAESGRLAALLAGDLPHSLVEHAEEAGVELLPYGGELTTECTCTSWVDPCVHGLAVLTALGWLVEADPFVLLHLRGLPREELLARLHARVQDPDGDPGGDEVEPGSGEAAEPELVTDLETALDAALRARRVLQILQGDDPDQPLDHLL
ncbi:hypothetical protein [Nocardioides ferulae]|uniref:SWIM zinc finger family protein n=1 Tax=Nocardioides ferulae TaxID=2340821 RepID=UPI001F0BA865|nr:hypothetical protein [Nocardioides ferulae]